MFTSASPLFKLSLFRTRVNNKKIKTHTFFRGTDFYYTHLEQMVYCCQLRLSVYRDSMYIITLFYLGDELRNE